MLDNSFRKAAKPLSCSSEGYAGVRVVGKICAIMGQIFCQGAPLHARNLIQRLFWRQTRLHALDECLAAKINLALQIIQDARQTDAGTHEILILGAGLIALRSKLSQY